MLGTYPRPGGLEAWSARGFDRVVLNAGPRRHDCPDVVAAVVLRRPASGYCDRKPVAVVDGEVVALVGLPANDGRDHAAQLPIRLRRHTPGPPGLRVGGRTHVRPRARGTHARSATSSDGEAPGHGGLFVTASSVQSPGPGGTGRS